MTEILIYPEFDVKTKTWFSPDFPKYEEKSIALLLRRLSIVTRKVVKAKDYYPLGTESPRRSFQLQTAEEFLKKPDVDHALWAQSTTKFFLAKKSQSAPVI